MYFQHPDGDRTVHRHFRLSKDQYPQLSDAWKAIESDRASLSGHKVKPIFGVTFRVYDDDHRPVSGFFRCCFNAEDLARKVSAAWIVKYRNGEPESAYKA